MIFALALHNTITTDERCDAARAAAAIVGPIRQKEKSDGERSRACSAT